MAHDMNLLIVDDEEMIREIVSSNLADLDINIIEASDGLVVY